MNIVLYPDIPLTIEQANQLFDKHVGQKVVSMRKNGFSSRHTIYFVTTEKTQDFVIRLAHPISPQRKIESEVAAMTLARERTTIPIPRIYGWSSSTVEVGAEYIIMECMKGDILNFHWDSLSLDGKKLILRELAEYLQQLNSITFQKVGSFRPSEDKQSLQPEHGPIIQWLPDDHTPDGCGPFTSVSDFYVADVNRAIIGLETIPELAPNRDLVSDIRRFVKEFLTNENLVGGKSITLAHNDVHATNIITDGKTITGLVDWELAVSYPQGYDFYNGFDFIERITIDADQAQILRNFLETEVLAADPAALSMLSKTGIGRQFQNFVYHICPPLIPGQFDVSRSRDVVVSFMSQFGIVVSQDDMITPNL